MCKSCLTSDLDIQNMAKKLKNGQNIALVYTPCTVSLLPVELQHQKSIPELPSGSASDITANQ
jgi:hypothetical protein